MHCSSFLKGFKHILWSYVSFLTVLLYYEPLIQSVNTLRVNPIHLLFPHFHSFSLTCAFHHLIPFTYSVRSLTSVSPSFIHTHSLIHIYSLTHSLTCHSLTFMCPLFLSLPPSSTRCLPHLVFSYTYSTIHKLILPCLLTHSLTHSCTLTYTHYPHRDIHTPIHALVSFIHSLKPFTHSLCSLTFVSPLITVFYYWFKYNLGQKC